MHLKYRKSCRICGNPALKPVINLGQQFLQGVFVKPGSQTTPTRRISTELVRCDPQATEGACGLLQTLVSVPPEVLYSSYWYRSGTNQTMRDHLAGIATEAADYVGKKDALALDIGCNDGTLLRAYPKSFSKIGIDPSNIASAIDGDYKVVNDFFPSPALTEVLSGRKCDIITSIAMFYDLEAPQEFVRALKNVLSQDGLWIFEMSYMPLMLEMNSYDTICHEHLEYYSLAVIEHLLRVCGMKVVRVGFNDINGGSIRCYATHADQYSYSSAGHLAELHRVRQAEFELELDTDRPYRHFQDRINNHQRELSDLIRKLRRDGKTVHVYGASTKGNTILQWCNLDSTLIPYAADRNPDKAGARTLGTDIAIISEDESRAMKPDYYLVLPWHFRKEFVKREQDILKAGTKFIFPLPEIEILGAEDLERLAPK